MRLKVAEQIDAARRTRQLASRERVGRYARGVIWTQISSFIRRLWLVLLFLLFFPLAISLLISLSMKGAERWIFIGAIGSSGPWLVAILVLLWGGVATTYMGIEGENSTADVLRKLRSQGWFLVNGMKIRANEDIDHVLVGSGGLLVFESKWSRHRWPIQGQGRTFMSDALNRAESQARENRSLFEWRFQKDLVGIKPQAICVLWSSEDSSDDAGWVVHKDVTVVRGPMLHLWLATLGNAVLDQTAVERIRVVLERQVASRDEVEIERSGPPPRTFNRYILEAVLAPFLGFILALSVLMAASHLGIIWILGGLGLCLVSGFLVSRVSKFRRAAVGWLAGTAASTTIIVAIELGVYLR